MGLKKTAASVDPDWSLHLQVCAGSTWFTFLSQNDSLCIKETVLSDHVIPQSVNKPPFCHGVSHILIGEVLLQYNIVFLKKIS
jgi:hypothetical protein